MTSTLANSPVLVAPPRADLDQRELLVALTRKVDALGLQLSHMYERTRAAEELRDELVAIGRDALHALQVELGSIEHEFNTDEIVHLLRQMLRSTPRFIRALEHLESLDSLAQELSPLGKDVMRSLVERLGEWEERGYFQLGADLLAIADRLAGHAKSGDTARLVDAIEPLLDTLAEATRPEVMALAKDALGAVADGPDKASPVGLWGLARATRDPAVRRGLGVLVEILRRLGAASAPRAELATETETQPERLLEE